MNHLTEYTASITELKTPLSKLLRQVKGKPIAILNRNKPSAYLVPASGYENLLELVDDYLLSKEIDKRLSDKSKPIKTTLNEL